MDTKAHTRYRTKYGEIVPGVTTVLGLLAKPALIYWAWNLGMQGEDYRKVRDKAADIGTVAHYLIECNIKGIEPNLEDFPPSIVKSAMVAYGAFKDWRATNALTTVDCECELVSECYLYGGKLDWVVKDAIGKLILVDVKTSKGIYEEHKYQLAAYWQMWDEKHPKEKLDRAAIIKLDKVTGEFSYHPFSNLDAEFQIFMHLRDVYALQKLNDKNRDRGKNYRRTNASFHKQEKGS